MTAAPHDWAITPRACPCRYPYPYSRALGGDPTFGWHRAEIIGTICSILLLLVVTALLVYEAIDRFFKTYKIEGEIMLSPASSPLSLTLL